MESRGNNDSGPFMTKANGELCPDLSNRSKIFSLNNGSIVLQLIDGNFFFLYPCSEIPQFGPGSIVNHVILCTYLGVTILMCGKLYS